MKLKSIKVTCNIWGNWVGFIGSSRAHVSGQQWNATDWLSDRLNEGGYKLSPKSDIKQADVDAHRANLAAPMRRV